MCRSIDSELYLISRYSGYGIAMGIVNGNGDISTLREERNPIVQVFDRSVKYGSIGFRLGDHRGGIDKREYRFQSRKIFSS